MQNTDFFSAAKMKNFIEKNICFNNIDCGYTLEPLWLGGSQEYPQSMFLSKNKKYPCKHGKSQFYYIKVDCIGVFISRICFLGVCRKSESESIFSYCSTLSRVLYAVVLSVQR